MSDCWFIKIKSMWEDGRLVTDDEVLTEEEAIDEVIEYWRDMPIDYCSWDLEKVCFKYDNGVEYD